MSPRAIVVLAIAPLLVGCSRPAVSEGSSDAASSTDTMMKPTGDSIPPGAVSFFRSLACPDGWAAYETAQGRTLVPTVGTTPGGSAVGMPLKHAEDRAHAHGLTLSVTIGSTSYAGIAGEANHGVGTAGTRSVMVTTTKTSSGLPYVELLACKKMAAAQPAARPIPPGVLMFFAADACPAGWSQAAATQGRLLVGVPQHGTAGLTFGGAALGMQEQRSHAHTAKGSVTTTSHGIALLGGCCAGGYALNGTYSYSATSDSTTVDFPYLQMLQCQKG